MRNFCSIIYFFFIATSLVAHIKTIKHLTFGKFDDSSPNKGFNPNSILIISDQYGLRIMYPIDLIAKGINGVEANWESTLQT